MKKLIEYPLADGSTILVEVDEPETKAGSVTRGGLRDTTATMIERADQTFDAALDRIRPAAAAIIAKLQDLATPPDQINVEFGIKLAAKAGAVIASADAEANFKIALTWKRDPGKP